MPLILPRGRHLYAFGLRALAAGQEEGRRGGTALGVLCFAVVVARVAFGLGALLSG